MQLIRLVVMDRTNGSEHIINYTVIDSDRTHIAKQEFHSITSKVLALGKFYASNV